jgi:predicted Co/Zn/Cd cation transporter (cation efflux family)
MSVSERNDRLRSTSMNALALQQTAQLLAADNGARDALAGVATAAVITVVVGGFLTLVIGALVSVLRSRLGGGMKFLWGVLVLATPVLGSLAWFVIGRRDAERRESFG